MNRSNKIERKNILDILGLTPLQEGMLFHYLQDPHGGLYFEQLSIEISGEINRRHFEGAWNVVVETNEMLRTVFHWEKLEKPAQIILKKHKCDVIFYDLSEKHSRQKKTKLEEIKDRDRREIFDIRRVPFRVILCKLEEKKHVIIISNHHILYDGWSNGIILKEFFKAYHELRTSGRGPGIKIPAKTPFKEFIKWTQNQDRNKQRHFWRQYLAGAAASTALPIKRRLEEKKGEEVEDYSIILEEEIRGKLEVFVKNTRATLAPVFYTAWGILLQRYCGSDDVVLGTTVSGRPAPVKGIEDMVGLFINTLPLRVQAGPAVKIIAVLTGIENQLREREEFENTPLADIRDYSAAAYGETLFTTIVAVENYPLDNRLIPEPNLLSLHSYSIREVPHYDLSVGIMPFNEMEIKFSYKRELFDKETIKNMAGHFKKILRHIIENPGAALSQIEIISAQEKSRILNEFNNTAAEYPRDKTVHELFAEQAEQTPDYIAIVAPLQKKTRTDQVYMTQHLCYHELNRQSQRLACLLIEKGVRADNIVGIMAEGSVEMVTGIIGILKAGEAYLPIDPDYPQERINYMLKDSSAGILLNGNAVGPGKSEILISKSETKPNDQNKVSTPIVLNFEHLNSEFVSNFGFRASDLNSSNLAYIIYTSGSTGKPKGVMIRHQSFIEFTTWAVDEFEHRIGCQVLLSNSYASDASIQQIFPPLISGGTLHLIHKELRLDADRYLDYLKINRINNIDEVPVIMKELLDRIDPHDREEKLPDLTCLSLGCEYVPIELVRRCRRHLNHRGRIINAYGPAEASVETATYHCDGTSDSEQSLIGKPRRNTRVYILDETGHCCPIGIPGEICISGVGLARGYLNRPELTAEKFDHDLWDYRDYHDGYHRSYISHMSYIYRTGDLARWQADGNIEFIGRIDNQVKIRGNRVELGEIERRLSDYPGIKEVAVSVREEKNGDKYICAYVVSHDENVIPGLREFLSGESPGYMIPAYFVQLAKIPLTPNGKVDRKALPKPVLTVDASYTGPRHECEMKLLGLWWEILAGDALNAAQLKTSIGIDDNFFHLGGHSLKATTLAAKMHKVFHVKVPLPEIFKRPTIRKLAAYINHAVGERYVPIAPVEKKEYYGLSSAQKRLYILARMETQSINYNMHEVFQLEGHLDKEGLEKSFKELIARHESLRTSFHLITDEPMQKITAADEVEFSIENYDLTGNEAPLHPTDEPGETGAITRINDGFLRHFDLSAAPLLRVGLIKLAANRHILMVGMHHIISDGISVNLFITDFTALYHGRRLSPLRLQYKDYSRWQNRRKENDKTRTRGEYWLKEFAGDISRINIPYDFPRPALQDFSGDTYRLVLGGAETGALKKRAREENVTLFMLLIAIYNVMLWKISGSEDIVVGTPTAGRRHEDLESIIGMFVNTLVLKTKINPGKEKSFGNFLAQVKQKTLAAFENQDYQFEDLVEAVMPTRDLGRNPLFDVMFVLQNMNTAPVEIPGLKLTPYPYETHIVQFEQNLPFTGLRGMNTRDVSPVLTGRRAQVKDFDGLPHPDRTLVNYRKYHRYIGIAPVKYSVSIQATRGCPYGCAYCHKIWPKTHVFRSAENIFAEIRACYRAGVKRFVFIDDIFNLRKDNSARFFETIIKHNYKVQFFFPNGLRGDILTPDFIDLMIAAGTINITLALETASPRLQKLIAKNLNLEKFEENIHYIAKKHPEVILEMEMMTGFPTETEAEALMMMELLKRIKWVHFPNLHILKIYPNTDMEQLALDKGISKQVIRRSAGLAFHELPETLPFSKRFVREYQTRLLDDYFLNKERLIHVLRHQVKILTRDELIQKYNSYLPAAIKSFPDILANVGISKEELGPIELLPDHWMAAPGFDEKIKVSHPARPSRADAFRVLLLDLSQSFQPESSEALYDVSGEPLGLMYLATCLHQQYGPAVQVKILKSRIDFGSYARLEQEVFLFKPHLIGLRTLSVYKEFFHRTVSLLKHWGITAPIITGGPYATSDYKQLLQDYHVDVAVLGEGELTAAQLVKEMMAHNNQLPPQEILKNIPGLAYIREQDKIAMKSAESRGEVLLLDYLYRQTGHFSMENPAKINRPGDLLYLISTSGTTGAPKSVMLEHRTLTNLMSYQFQCTGIDFTRVPQYAAIGFDVSLQEIFSPLLTGGTLYLPDDNMRHDVPRLFDFIAGNRVNILFLPPAFLKYILSEPGYAREFPRWVQHIIAAGEQLVIDEPLRQLLKKRGITLHNHYGPSETHVVTSLTLEPTGGIPHLPGIGKPIANTLIYILDNNGKPQPVGVTGEIYIGGIQVGRGYLGNAALTAEKFVPNPFDPGGRLYRSGDRARWQPDGTIRFLGRLDNQVKIRGFRIETGEIENRLLKHRDIKGAVVTVREDGRAELYLAAYYVSHSGFKVPGIREFLLNVLPDYMIPAYFVHMRQIPLIPSGKVDRRALPAPASIEAAGNVTASSPIEKKLAEIWHRVLANNSLPTAIGIDENFFQLGGHSLKATSLAARMNKEFQVKIPLGEIFKNPTIRGLFQYIKTVQAERYTRIAAAEEKEYYVLSSAQKRLYFLQQMEKVGTVYNISAVWKLAGKVDRNRLQQSLAELIQRHESFRTSFELIDEEPVQRIHKQVQFEMEYYEVEVKVKVEEEEQTTEGRRQTTGDRRQGTGEKAGTHPSSEFIRPFDLSEAPLLRVRLVKFGEENYILMVDMHHIAADGMSVRVLVRDFSALYADKELPGIKVRYRDYAQWQNRERVSKEIRQQGEYWKKEYEGEIPVLDLPTDYARTRARGFAGDIIQFEIDKQTAMALKVLAQEGGATLYMVLLALYNILLARLSSREDIVIGTPASGRRHADMENIIGMFVNTLALRNYPAGEKGFMEFLEEVKQGTLKALENQEYQYEDLVETVAVTRDISRNPLFDTMFALQDPGIGKIETPRLKWQPYAYENKTAKFDLSLTGEQKEEKLSFTFEYRTELYKRKTVQRFTVYFKNIIKSIVENKNRQIAGIEILTAAEKQRILFEFNETGREYSREKTLQRLFEEQAARTPDYISLVGTAAQGDSTDMPDMIYISHRKLNRKSRELAHRLQERGVKSGVIVGIMVERILEMVMGIIGILKAGGVYMPIDPGHPGERIDYMLKDSGAVILLTQQEIVDLSSPLAFDNHPRGTPIFPSPLAFFYPCNSSNLAYIIYTSGTTGRPRGVMVEHRSVVRLVENPVFIEAKKGQRLLMTGVFTFDIVTFEIWWSLLKGLCLYQAEKSTLLDPAAMEKAISLNRIDILHLVPQLFNQLYTQNPGIFAGLTYFLIGGDRVTPRDIWRLRRKYKKLKILHMYGPTEAATFSTYLEVDRVGKNDRGIPIGKPVNNTAVYILGSNNELLPIGVKGHLYIGGPGLARGYLNNPGLTTKKFDRDLWNLQDYHDEKKNYKQSTNRKLQITNKKTKELPPIGAPHNKKFLQGGPGGAVFIKKAPPGRRRQKLYKTGDLACWLSNGNIEFLGRIDQQVKIRGNRIELAEIESRLLNHKGIKEAVVTAFEEKNGNKYLCAYIAAGSDIEESSTRQFLLKYLPGCMIPSYFIKMEKIPLKANGKINRAALPVPRENIPEHKTKNKPPRNAVEKKLVEIWQKVLAREEVGINRDFFAMGGDSIKAIRVISGMSSAGYKLEIKDFFQTPVISELALRVKKPRRNPGPSTITGTIPLTPIQEKFFSEPRMAPHHYNPSLMLYSREGFEKESIKEIFTKIQAHHDVLRMTYKRDGSSGRVIQVNHGLDYPFFLREYDIRNHENSYRELKARANGIQAGIDLEKGPMMKVGLFHLDDGDRLLIVIHHLVIDGISWRILIEDIDTLYRQYKKGEKLQLPAKTDSFKAWSEKLSAYANSKAFLKEKIYWQKIESIKAPLIPKDFAEEENQINETRSEIFTLREEETGLLLTKVNGKFKTEINDILLTALGMAIKKTFGQDLVLIALEGHGREEIPGSLEISRTLGWFTALYPVVLDLSPAGAPGPGGRIKKIKETLRGIPIKGIGYGILKYLTREENKKEMEFKLKPQISFNYLGQLDAEIKQVSSFEIAQKDVGTAQSLSSNGKREYLLEVTGMTVNNRLTMKVSYNKRQFKPGTIARLLGNFETELTGIIACCRTGEKIEPASALSGK